MSTPSPGAPYRVLPWLIAGLFLAAAVVGWQRAREAGLESARSRAMLAVAEARQREVESSRAMAEASQDELDRLRKQVEELHRLRAQYQEWQRDREEAQRLKGELSRLQAAAASAGASAARASTPVSWVGLAMGGQEGGGVVVQAVVPGGPAEAAGLQVGDVITRLEGRLVGGPADFRSVIGSKQPGTQVTLDLVRGGAAIRLAVSTAPYPN